jgi:hypothetical protein
MVNAASTAAGDVLGALGAGRMYAVAGRQGRSGTVLKSVEVIEGTVRVVCEGAPATFSFIGQEGRLLKTVRAARSATYAVAPDDAYIRTVIRAPDAVLYLNPVVRYDGVRLDSPKAMVDRSATRRARVGVAVACVLLLVVVGRWRG